MRHLVLLAVLLIGCTPNSASDLDGAPKRFGASVPGPKAIALTCGTGLSCSPSTITGSGTVSSLAPSFFMSAYTLAAQNSKLVVGSMGTTGNDQTQGFDFTPTVPIHTTGAHLWWYLSTPRTVTCTIWTSTGSVVVTGTASITGAGAFTCTFASTALVPSQVYTIGFRDNSGNDYSAWNYNGSFPFNGTTGLTTFPFLAGPNIIIVHWAVFSNGNTRPVSQITSAGFPIDPIFTVD